MHKMNAFDEYNNVSLDDLQTPIARIGYMNLCLSSIESKHSLIAEKFAKLEVVLGECIRKLDEHKSYAELIQDLEYQFAEITQINNRVENLYNITSNATAKLHDRCDVLVNEITNDNELIDTLYTRLNEIETKCEVFEVDNKIDYIYNVTENAIHKLQTRCDDIDTCIETMSARTDERLSERITQIFIANYMMFSMFLVIHYILSTALYE
jgi:DNA repair ATPase RecN